MIDNRRSPLVALKVTPLTELRRSAPVSSPFCPDPGSSSACSNHVPTALDFTIDRHHPRTAVPVRPESLAR
jgi:hypothetical protein